MFDTLSFSATDKVAFVTKSNDASFVTKAKEVGSEVNVYSTAVDVLALEGGEFTKIVVDQESAEEFLNLGGLAKVAKFLAGGGEISIARADGNEKLDTKFLLGGYVEVSESKVEAPAENASVIWSAKIPKYEAAAKLLPKKKKEEGKSANAVWKLMANDFDDNAYELENEDDLLKGDEAPKPSSSAAAECGPNSGKKRACKNCSCGLKDMEGEPVVSEAELQKSISGCGNCAKGDAFRCGGCPYLGLPTFTPGTKPEIVVKEDGAKVLVDMTSDI